MAWCAMKLQALRKVFATYPKETRDCFLCYEGTMRVVLAYQSALECWQAYGLDESLCSLSASSSVRPKLDCRPKEIKGLEVVTRGIVSTPVHVLVPGPEYRRDSKSIMSHVIGSALPRGLLWRLDDAVSVVSPELCFLQMASILSIQKSIELGIELCGTYQPNPQNASGMATRPRPLTTVRKLAAVADALSHVKGSPTAKRALLWVRPGSASPMETLLWMRLCLPPRFGGWGFPAAEFNHAIELSPAESAAIGKHFLCCDLYFPKHRVAVEYDSSEFHTGDERIANDSVRRGVLERTGVKVLTITRREFFTYHEFEPKVRQLASLLGKRISEPTDEQQRARRILRAELLGGGLMRYV